MDIITNTKTVYKSIHEAAKFLNTNPSTLLSREKRGTKNHIKVDMI